MGSKMEFNPVTRQIVTQLETHGMWHETFEHEPVRTSEQAARIRPEYSLRQGAKAILLRIKKNESEKLFVMLVFPADRQFDKTKVKKWSGARDLRFATEAEVLELTGGVEPGGVPPFGNLFALRVIADPTLFENEKIVFNAGDRRFSVAMRSEDYRRLVNPEIVEIT
jgi:Ala-tRNA(Pro) deacylase